MQDTYITEETLTEEVADTTSDTAEDASATLDTHNEEKGHTQDEGAGYTDYEALIAEDIAILKSEFPELKGVSEITDLNNPLRYAALRDLGLSPIEAYLATARRSLQDTRAHLKSARGRSVAAPTSMMSQGEMAAARDLFPGMSDSQIQQLYKRVTK